MASRDINDLHPLFRPIALAALAGAKARGINLHITCTKRSLDEQARLYAQGRSRPGKIVTKAKPGMSAHNYGLALDVVVIGPDGKADWNVRNPGWKIWAEEGIKAGGDAGGLWKRLKDWPHLQMRNWKAYK